MAIDLQYDLTNYTPADAGPVEANFNRIEQYVNQELIIRDGTVAMTGDLQLARDPATPLAAATKRYVDDILPVGIIIPYAGTVAPPGGRWMPCDGRTLATAAYPVLFGVIGYNFGGSGGAFNLPNMTGRVTVGSGAAAVGTTGGSANGVVVDHTHTISHTHTTDPVGDHYHGGVSDHYHALGGSTGLESSPHYHEGVAGSGQAYVTYGGPLQVGTGSGVFGTAPSTNWNKQDHTHVLPANTGAADRGLVTGYAGTHAHSIPAGGGSSGGASGAVAATNANMQPYVVVTNLIRIS
jgi:microcystin-dependent protein